MDLDALKETLGEEAHTELATFVNDLVGQRDSARRESIDHRKSLKQKVSELEEQNNNLTRTQSELFERLGVESADELADLDPKGQAEAAKQYEARVKRMERDLAERQQAYDGLFQKHRSSLQTAAMQGALSKHDWIDRDLVATFVQSRLIWDDDTVKYQADDGLTMDLSEAMQVLAKEKPHLVKAAGSGGSGYRASQKPGDATQKTMARDEFEKLDPSSRMAFIKRGGTLTE